MSWTYYKLSGQPVLQQNFKETSYGKGVTEKQAHLLSETKLMSVFNNSNTVFTQ